MSELPGMYLRWVRAPRRSLRDDLREQTARYSNSVIMDRLEVVDAMGNLVGELKGATSIELRNNADGTPERYVITVLGMDVELFQEAAQTAREASV